MAYGITVEAPDETPMEMWGSWGMYITVTYDTSNTNITGWAVFEKTGTLSTTTGYTLDTAPGNLILTGSGSNQSFVENGLDFENTTGTLFVLYLAESNGKYWYKNGDGYVGSATFKRFYELADVTVSDYTDTTITASVSKVTNATYYHLGYATSTTVSPNVDWQFITQTSRSFTITGLEPETTYYLRSYTSNAYSTGPYSSAAVVTTEEEIIKLEDPVITSGPTISGKSCTLKFKNPSANPKVNYYVYLDGVSNLIASGTVASSGTKTLTFEFEDYETEYLFEIVFSKSGYEDGYFYDYYTSGAMPSLTTPTYSTPSISGKSISFTVYNNNSVLVNYKIALGGTNMLSGTISGNGSKSVSLTGEDFNTTYTVRIDFTKDDYKSSYKTFSVTTGSKAKPATFSWTYTKSSGGEFNLTRTEWNNFMATLQAEVEYVGLTCLEWTKITGTPAFSAKICNQAYNILSQQLQMGGYGTLYEVSGNDPIKASLLNQFVTELNQAINVYGPDQFG